VSSPTADVPVLRTFPRLRRRALALALIVVAVLVLRYALSAFVSIETNLLWFRSVQHESVYTRTFWTEALLFVIFGVLMAVAIANNLIAFHRNRPTTFTPDPAKQRTRYQFQRVEQRLRRWLFVIIVGYFGITMGSRAAGNWQTWLAWRHATSFGQKDPQFHRDLSYYVFVYPLHRLVLTLLFRIVATSIIVVLISAYAYGGVRLRGTGPRMTRAVRSQLSILIGLYLVLKAFGYWLDRYALITSNRGVVTGPAYTDVHAVIPGRIVLIVIALICAGLLFANVFLNSPKVMYLGIGLMAFAALVVGVAWPAVVQQFREKPSASQVELPYIAHNIKATRQAYGLDTGISTTEYDGTNLLHGTALATQAARDAQIRLLDPNQLSPTFNFEQQVQSYYGFKSTLDIDHYLLGGTQQDLALAVRELTQSGLPASRQSWTNTHLVYTHGYGLVAAPTDALPDGTPSFIDGGLPPTSNQLGVTQPRIYYGQMSPSYSIVGAAPGSAPREFDQPSSTGSGAQLNYTHTGGGGIPLGSTFNRLLYAYKLHSASILFSSEINNDSQLLTVRNPRARVAAVAPWLTLDGDAYPTVVNGHILWVVDGYTTSNNYPDSQQINLRSATTSTLTQSGATVAQQSSSINYMRNSVKATVDAYSGKVTLYAWNQVKSQYTPDPLPDPVLDTWEHAFPGLVQPQSAIPSALLAHLRYPQDLFNVQRNLLTRYHVTSANEFYAGDDFWVVPNDPTVTATSTINSVGKKVTNSAPSLASAYMSLSPTGYTAADYSLSSPLVTLNSRNLAAFLSVDSQPGPDYGKLSLLDVPIGQSLKSPLQVQTDIESDTQITDALSLARTGNSKVVLGNLLTIPVGGQILYIEPVYTQAKGGNSFPILRHVIAIYGNGQPAFKSTLPAALDEALGVTVPLAGQSGTAVSAP
jgi:uncharacterized membrane protein (UPF0182 family)